HLLGGAGAGAWAARDQRPALHVDPPRVLVLGDPGAVLDRPARPLLLAEGRAGRVLAEHRASRRDAAGGARVRPSRKPLSGGGQGRDCLPDAWTDLDRPVAVRHRDAALRSLSD